MQVVSFFRTWQSRRVIYSKETLFFSPIGDDVVVDVVPIVEIVEINKVIENENRNLNGGSQTDLIVEKKIHKDSQNSKVATLSQCRFQIITDPDGYNSGRKYVLQASSDEVCTATIKELTTLAKIEKKKAERRSKFQRTQAKVKRIFLSNGFHILMSTMILVVSDENKSIAWLQILV
jgi:hypothetical protein